MLTMKPRRLLYDTSSSLYSSLALNAANIPSLPRRITTIVGLLYILIVPSPTFLFVNDFLSVHNDDASVTVAYAVS